jgi:hypothetical protein
MNKVYITEKGNSMRNMGPDKKVIMPGKENAFPVEWMNKNTLDKLIADKEMAYLVAGETDINPDYDGDLKDMSDAPTKPTEPASEPAKEEGDGESTEELFKKLCVADAGDLSNLSRGDLDAMANDILEQAGVDKKSEDLFSNMGKVISFLTGQDLNIDGDRD